MGFYRELCTLPISVMNPITTQAADTLMTALEMCIRIHRDDRDRGGMPYVFHLLRVMSKQRTMERKIIALLHDSVENHSDTFNLQEITTTFGPDISAAVDALTRRSGEAWEEYIKRILENENASFVKLADLEDNMDPRRMDEKSAKKVHDQYFAAHKKICTKYGIFSHLRV